MRNLILTPREWFPERDRLNHEWLISQRMPVVVTCPKCDNPSWTFQWRHSPRVCPYCDYAVLQQEGLRPWWARDELMPEFPPNQDNVYTSLDGEKWERIPFCSKCALQAWKDFDDFREQKVWWRLGVRKESGHVHVVTWRNRVIYPICGRHVPRKPAKREEVPPPPESLDELNKALFPNA